jgi:hypothetical protein
MRSADQHSSAARRWQRTLLSAFVVAEPTYQ